MLFDNIIGTNNISVTINATLPLWTLIIPNIKNPRNIDNKWMIFSYFLLFKNMNAAKDMGRRIQYIAEIVSTFPMVVIYQQL